MSRLSDEHKYPPKKTSAPSRKGGIFPYKPSKEHVAHMEKLGYSAGDALADMEARIREGVGFTIGYNPDKDGVYAIARDTDAPFGENVSVSCWAGSVSKALVGLGYYLRVVNPDFPNGTQLEFPQLSDW